MKRSFVNMTPRLQTDYQRVKQCLFVLSLRQFGLHTDIMQHLCVEIFNNDDEEHVGTLHASIQKLNAKSFIWDVIISSTFNFQYSQKMVLKEGYIWYFDLHISFDLYISNIEKKRGCLRKTKMKDNLKKFQNFLKTYNSIETYGYTICDSEEDGLEYVST